MPIIARDNARAVELKKLTSAIPIVLSRGPGRFGLVESLARPGAQCDGLSLMATDLSGSVWGC